MKRLFIILMALFAFSSVCFADGNENVLNHDEQFAYDCIDKWYTFLDNSKVRFKAVDATGKDNVEKGLCVISLEVPNQFGGMSFRNYWFKDGKPDMVYDGIGDSDIWNRFDIAKMNRVWKEKHPPEQ